MFDLSYIASPYSHPDKWVQEARAKAAAIYTAAILEKGGMAFSPICHSHELAKVAKLPGDADFWEKWNGTMLRRCTQLIVLCLPGWEKSLGIRFEIGYATARDIPIKYVHLHELPTPLQRRIETVMMEPVG